MNDSILDAIAFFTRETGILDCLAVCCGQGDRRAWAMDGREAGEHTLFDLASVTKIFTGLCLMRLWEEGLLNPFKRVSFYSPEFTRLNAVTVEQLMAFQVRLVTPQRIDACEDRESALRCLKNTCFTGAAGRRAYSDIPCMVLKYVVEKVSGMSMMNCVRRLILDPAGMSETFASVPSGRLSDCLLYGPEYRIEGERWILRPDPVRGVPHDPKAAILQGSGDDLCGHAGLFSTLSDMELLARAILEERIVSRESLQRMAVNRTGRMLPDGTFTQYLGYCCYRKHPDQYFSEIPSAMSREAFGIGGFTGNHFSVDPGTGRYTVFLGNRVRNRLTVLIPPEGRRLEDYGLRPDGSGRIRWEDGSFRFSSVNYVHQKDARLHAVVDRVLSGP